MMPFDESIIKSLESSACVQALEAIVKECDAQKAKWFAKCKNHENRVKKEGWITSDMDTFLKRAEDLYGKGNPEPLVDLLDEVRKYDPR